MASVDGFKFLHAGSDEVYSNICDPCNHDGRETEALHFCQDCQENLCSCCAESHKRFKSSRHHVIVAIANMTEGETAAATTDENMIVCTCDQSMVVTHFCENHLDVICGTCKTVKHRTCKSVEIQRKSIDYTTDKVEQVLDRVKGLKRKFETFKQHRNVSFKDFEESKENCLMEITNYRDEIKAAFDRLENNLIEEAQKLEKKIKQDNQHCLNTSTTAETILEADINILDDAKTYGQSDQMFAAGIRTTAHIKEFEAIFEELQLEVNNQVKLTFERNEKLTDLLRSLHSMGSVTLDETSSVKPEGKGQGIRFDNKNVVSIEKIDVSYKTDKTTQWITGCAVLPSGQGVLICDHLNNTIKHLDADFNITECLHLAQPWDIAAYASNEAVITQPNNKQIQIIDIHPQLKIGEPCIKFDKKCWGVSVLDSDIIISFHDAQGNGLIRVIDRKGTIKRYLGTGLSLKAPSYIFANPLLPGKLYISDFKKSSIFCITLYDTLIYKYSSSGPSCSKHR